MANYICRFCESQTDNPRRICHTCKRKLVLIRRIKAMLKPYADMKKELQRTGQWRSRVKNDE